MATMPPKRKNTYEVHLYLPAWMREALREEAEVQRWSVNTVIEVAAEEWLKARGRFPPQRE